MIQSVALTGAALRVMRTAAGRRVLRVVLLVGALFALGFLCGEQAQAADGAVPAPVTEASSASAGGARSLTSGAVAGATHTPSGSVAGSPALPDAATAPDLPDPPSRSALPDVADVADVASLPDVPDAASLPELSELPDLADLADLPKLPPSSSLPPLSSLPSLPAPPTVPSRPTLPPTPTVPGLPQVPGAPSTPVHTLPVPVTSAPQPGSSTSPTAPTATDGQTPGGRSDAKTPLTYGPRSTTDFGVTGVATQSPVHRAAHPAPAPAPQGPRQDPGGVPSGKAAGDSGTGTPRHGGDAHAVTFDHRAPLRLAPGATVGADAYGTRDRHRDIPVSPA